jgi:hypothetical protein
MKQGCEAEVPCRRIETTHFSCQKLCNKNREFSQRRSTTVRNFGLGS